jgi:hypothetical protein
MRPARKLFVLAAMTLTVLALGVTTANAENPVEVIEEETGEHCTAVSLGAGHAVSGGCHIAYESEGHIPWVAYVPSPVIISQCAWHLDAQIGEDGSGYITNAVLFNGPVSEAPGCTRAPCDEAGSGAMLPWPLQIVEGENETDPSEDVEVEFCLRTIASGQGGAPSRCQVHVPITQDAVNHNHEIGTPAGEYFCEVSPQPFPISIRDVHFNVEEPAATEDIEILH